MRIAVEAVLRAAPNEVRAALDNPALLRFIAWPLLGFRPIGAPFPERWTPGEYRAWLLFAGVFPLGRQWIVISHPTPMSLRDNGRGDLVRRWDHLIVLEAHPKGTLYRDRVDIEAGVLTLPVWVFAWVFYRWRQRRWQRLIANGLDTL
ncbi:MAG: hypothetical protein AAFQ36_06210 [Pseudomonadota bacterium]